jgi:protein-arginine kinase activator protein McsA
MGKDEPNVLIDRLIAEITLLSCTYKEAIKSNKEFSEAKNIRNKIKELEDQLKQLVL